MSPISLYLCTLPLTVLAWRSHQRRLIWRELNEEHAKLEGSETPDFGSSVEKSRKDILEAEIGPRNHPKQNLVEGRRTVEDQWRWWCVFLSKKHAECAKLNGSDEPLCGVFKNGWLKDCATLDGKPKRVFVEDRSIFEGGQEHL